ncbi:MAG: diphthine--ammonia ligase [Verrucomicrobia bacterium]|nr:diphthine--ammonia ligase [Verrucomicrobiota bacterium]MDE3098486.1 diphthine--ammonia ligase [Verrucomicrobiota bacterium]
MKKKIIFCWSGGKDSALALNRLRTDDRYEVVSLLTTCNEHFQRVSMHGVRLELLDAQARSIGLPLEKVFVSRRGSNEEYQEKMAATLAAHRARGISGCAFGDIFLEDLKLWREENLARMGMTGVFPIWKEDTRELMREFFALGFGTVICCANDAYLDERAAGRRLDPEFLASLPETVDPCGENGEFHTFAFAGPIFSEPVKFAVGEKVHRPVEATHPGDSTGGYACPSSPRRTKGFWFCDLLPA